MFIDACVKGELQLDPEYGKQVGLKDLSSFDQNNVPGSKSVSYYQITKPKKALLVIAQYDPPPKGGVTQLCMMNANGHQRFDFETQVELVQRAVLGSTTQYLKNQYSYQIYLPDDKALITLYPWQMYVQTLDAAALARLPKKGFAGFGIRLNIPSH